jgi:pimeloyl-ACP methyl ester carboxylesterase
MDRLSRDVVDLIDLLGHDKVFLAGHDWGAAVTWWTAVRFPQRLHRVAVLNVPHPSVMRRTLRSSWRQLRRSWYMFLFQLPWLPEWLLRRNDFAFAVKSLVAIARRGTFSDDDLATYRRAWSQPGTMTAMLNWYRAALRVPPARVPSVRVTVPMRILWGMRDPALGSEMVEPSLAYCDDGEAVRLPELTHWLQHEDPERVADLLIEHFRVS